MKPYPDTQSVLVMDNCRIHHTDLLQEVLNENGELEASNVQNFTNMSFPGVMILFLPPYSPDLNPIEESFSTCTWSGSYCILMTDGLQGKLIYAAMGMKFTKRRIPFIP